MDAEQPHLRLDKFLWQTRFFKTRVLATELVNSGKVRVNGIKVSKASQPVRAGDGLTFPQGREVRIVRVVALPLRRGPASEAQSMYEDLDAAVAPILPYPS